jgi:hypothetical protein
MGRQTIRQLGKRLGTHTIWRDYPEHPANPSKWVMERFLSHRVIVSDVRRNDDITKNEKAGRFSSTGFQKNFLNDLSAIKRHGTAQIMPCVH